MDEVHRVALFDREPAVDIRLTRAEAGIAQDPRRYAGAGQADADLRETRRGQAEFGDFAIGMNHLEHAVAHDPGEHRIEQRLRHRGDLSLPRSGALVHQSKVVAAGL